MATLELVSSGSGIVESARLQNTATAANDNGTALVFAANRTTSGLTNIAEVAGLITDISESEYNGALTFSTSASEAPTEQMRITAGGDVGIGTTDPLRKLDVEGAGRFTEGLWLEEAAVIDGGSNTINMTNGIWTFVTGSRVDFTAEVSNSSPLYLTNQLTGTAKQILMVPTFVTSGAGQIQHGIRMEAINQATNANANTVYGLEIYIGDANTLANTDVGLRVDLSGVTNGSATKYAALFGGGNVGIGTTSPASRLDIADGAVTMQEMTAPSAPASNKCVIYAEDNGSGKTRLMVKFATGAAQQMAIEP